MRFNSFSTFNIVKLHWEVSFKNFSIVFYLLMRWQTWQRNMLISLPMPVPSSFNVGRDILVLSKLATSFSFMESSIVWWNEHKQWDQIWILAPLVEGYQQITTSVRQISHLQNGDNYPDPNSSDDLMLIHSTDT